MRELDTKATRFTAKRGDRGVPRWRSSSRRRSSACIEPPTASMARGGEASTGRRGRRPSRTRTTTCIERRRTASTMRCARPPVGALAYIPWSLLGRTSASRTATHLGGVERDHVLTTMMLHWLPGGCCRRPASTGKPERPEFVGAWKWVTVPTATWRFGGSPPPRAEPPTTSSTIGTASWRPPARSK